MQNQSGKLYTDPFLTSSSKYRLICSETGKVLEKVDTLTEANKLLKEYREEDKIMGDKIKYNIVCPDGVII